MLLPPLHQWRQLTIIWVSKLIFSFWYQAILGKRTFEVEDNSKFLKKVGEVLNTKINGVPFLVIGDKYFIGYADGLTSIQIEDKVKECLEKDCVDIVGNLLKTETHSMISIAQRLSLFWLRHILLIFNFRP